MNSLGSTHTTPTHVTQQTQHTPTSHDDMSTEQMQEQLEGLMKSLAVRKGVDPRALAKQLVGVETADKATQTDPMDVVRWGTVANVVKMYKGIDNQTSIGEAQSQEMSNKLAELSQFPMPKHAKVYDMVTMPPDVMKYLVKTATGTETRDCCPETNGTGFGGTRDFAPEQYQELNRTYTAAGREIVKEALGKGELPCIISANSGREGAVRNPDGSYPAEANSKMIWEKTDPADRMAEVMGTQDKPCYVESMDTFVQPYLKARDQARDALLDTMQRAVNPETKTKINKAAISAVFKGLGKGRLPQTSLARMSEARSQEQKHLANLVEDFANCGKATWTKGSEEYDALAALLPKDSRVTMDDIAGPFVDAMKDAHAAASAEMAKHKDKPLMLQGYSRDVATCCTIENGRPYLFGRPVNGMVNDRAVKNLEMKEGEKIDFKQTALMNCTVDEGVDKFASAMARVNFHNSDLGKSLAQEATKRGFKYDVCGLDQLVYFPKGAAEDTQGKTGIELDNHRQTYFRGVTKEEGLAGVRAAVEQFRALGIRPMFKPAGTGQSKGLIALKDGESTEAFMERFATNMQGIKRDFGAGAGYPFMVEATKTLAQTADGQEFDLRWANFQKAPSTDENGEHVPAQIQCVALIQKKSAVDAKKKAETGFAATNVTASVAATGKKASDFIIPLASEKGLAESEKTFDQLASTGLYFSAFAKFLLETTYSRA